MDGESDLAQFLRLIRASYRRGSHPDDPGFRPQGQVLRKKSEVEKIPQPREGTVESLRFKGIAEQKAHRGFGPKGGPQLSSM
jgi:hypothetical protein